MIIQEKCLLTERVKTIQAEGRDPDRWGVKVSNDYEHIHVYAIKGLVTYLEIGGWHVYPPNWFERLIGITFESKLKKVFNRAQRFVDKQNKREDAIAEAVKKMSDFKE